MTNVFHEQYTFCHLNNIVFFFLFYYRTLDFSFNKIRKIRNIGTLVKLENLFFVNNKISKIENLASFTNLTMLELGSNRIRVSLFLERFT